MGAHSPDPDDDPAGLECQHGVEQSAEGRRGNIGRRATRPDRRGTEHLRGLHDDRPPGASRQPLDDEHRDGGADALDLQDHERPTGTRGDGVDESGAAVAQRDEVQRVVGRRAAPALGHRLGDLGGGQGTGQPVGGEEDAHRTILPASAAGTPCGTIRR